MVLGSLCSTVCGYGFDYPRLLMEVRSQSVCMGLAYFNEHNVFKVSMLWHMSKLIICHKIHIYIPHFVYPFICWWTFGLFLPFLAVVNNIAVKMGVQIPLLVPAFSSQGYIDTIGIAGSHGNSSVVFWRSSILFSTAAELFYTPTSTTQGLISAHFHQHLIFSDYCCCNSSPNGCEAASHCGTGFFASSLKKHSRYLSILAISPILLCSQLIA